MSPHQPAAEAIIVHDDAPIADVAGLAGKTVGVQKGSGCHYLLLAALERAGLSLDDIEVRYLEAADGGAAFANRSLDAWVIWDPFLATTQARTPTRTLADGRDGLTSYHRYYMVNDAFVSERPEAVQIVFEALRGAGERLRADPAAAANRLASLWGNLPAETVRVINSRRSYDVQPVDASAMGEQQKIADAFYAAGVVPRKLDTSQVPVWQPRSA